MSLIVTKTSHQIYFFVHFEQMMSPKAVGIGTAFLTHQNESLGKQFQEPELGDEVADVPEEPSRHIGDGVDSELSGLHAAG